MAKKVERRQSPEQAKKVEAREKLLKKLKLGGEASMAELTAKVEKLKPEEQSLIYREIYNATEAIVDQTVPRP